MKKKILMMALAAMVAASVPAIAASGYDGDSCTGSRCYRGDRQYCGCGDYQGDGGYCYQGGYCYRGR